MKIIIHCGAYKTGSSSIQNFCYQKRGLLINEHNILYPKTGLFYSKEIGYRHTKLFYSYGKCEWDKFIENLNIELKDMESKGVKTVVFSSEALSNPIMHNSLRAFISILNSWGYSDISGIVYVRNIYGFIVRHYREFTFRHKNRLNVGSWLAKHQGVYDYPSVYSTLNDIFGKKLSFFVYEEIGSVLNHFLKLIGLNLKCDERERANAGVAPIDIEFYRQSNIKYCAHKGLNFSEESKTEYGLLWSENISEYPSLLTHEKTLENFDWRKLKLEFNLSDEQLDLIRENPNRHNDIDVYKLSNLLSLLVDDMVKK